MIRQDKIIKASISDFMGKFQIHPFLIFLFHKVIIRVSPALPDGVHLDKYGRYKEIILSIEHANYSYTLRGQVLKLQDICIDYQLFQDKNIHLL